MARGNAAMSIGMVVMVAMIVGAAAAAPAPAPSVDCTTVVLNLSDCLGFVTGTDKTPPKACCTELATVVKSDPQCLCLLFNTTFTQPLGVNITLAQQLPSKCKVQTPSTSLCALVGIPVPGPVSPVTAPSPAAKTPTSTPVTAPSSSPTPATSTATSPSPATSAPAGSTAPSGSSATPAANSTTSPASSPNGAHSISHRNVGAAASLLLIASIFLSQV